MTEKSEFTTTANLRPICCQNRTNSSFDLKKNNRGNKKIPWYSNRGSFSTQNRAQRSLQSPMLNVLKRDPMLGAWQRAGKKTSNKKPMGRALRWGLELNSWKETERLAANIPFFWPSVRSWTCFFGLLPDFDRALWELTPSKQQAVFFSIFGSLSRLRHYCWYQSMIEIESSTYVRVKAVRNTPTVRNPTPHLTGGRLILSLRQPWRSRTTFLNFLNFLRLT